MHFPTVSVKLIKTIRIDKKAVEEKVKISVWVFF